MTSSVTGHVTASAGTPSAHSMGTDGPAKVAFLWSLSDKFEKEGNMSESVKSAQTALLLQHSLLGGGEAGGAGLDATKLSMLERQFEQPLHKAAQTLVLKCNAQAVEFFQRDQYDVASFLLDRALFLTNDTPSTNCFLAVHAHDRLRLRAATYNNLGCLEKRRNNYDSALELLQKAVEVESLVDPDLGPSASTNLNLCTVLNKVRRHAQATTAAERAVQALKFHMQQGHENFPHFAQMLAMAYYNLGVSLEFTGGAYGAGKATEAYRNVIDVNQRYLERGQTGMGGETSNLTEVASQAIERIRLTNGSTPTLPAIGGGYGGSVGYGAGGHAPQQRLALTAPGGVRKAKDRVGADTPTSTSSYTPRPPSQTASQQDRPLSMTNRGFGNASALSTASGIGGRSGGRLDQAVNKHAERIMTRQKRQAAMKERDQMALKKAQQAHVKEKEKKLRKEKEQEEQRREEFRDELFDQMVAGLRAAQVREIKHAARAIQAAWRGWMTRDYIKTLLKATVRIQAVYRSHRCRRKIRVQNELARIQELDAIRLKNQVQAAVSLQRRVRKFLRRCADLRAVQIRRVKMNASARIAQRFYRDHRARVRQRIIDKLEAERTADQERHLKIHKAACSIQGLYRSFKSRRFLRVVRLEQARRGKAAVKIQAQMRGALTRTWFRHYRLYRRQQELSTSKNLNAIRKIQRAWRLGLAKMMRRRLENERAYRNRQLKVLRAAIKIQCAWRSCVARHRASARRRIQRRRVEAAIKIQNRWTVFKCRKEYLFRIQEVRLLRSLKEIQRWGRAMVVRKKHLETANYHAILLQREQVALVRTQCAMHIQCYARQWISLYRQEFVRVGFNKRTAAIMMVQSAGRHYKAQKELATVKRITLLVQMQTEHEELCRASAITIQTHVRSYLARKRAALMRKKRVMALSIQCAWRQHLARSELGRRQAIKLTATKDMSARMIQRSVRLFLKRQELKRLDAYYSERQRQKLWQQRREEAAICVQSQWKGYATRKAVGAERSRLLQNTVDAIRIQRAWRTCQFRRSIKREVKRRIDQKYLRDHSARKIQSLWRGVLAREFVSLLREKRFNNTVSVIVMQCAWRSYGARMERRIRKTQRLYDQRISAEQHDLCVLTASLVVSCLKTMGAQRRRLKKIERNLSQELDDRRKWRAKHLFEHATRIQSWYRGCYERVYVRGVLKEKRERDAVQAASDAKEAQAASRIQRGVRCSFARREATRRRFEKNMKAQEEQLERDRTAKPTDIIKSIFWAMEAANQRDYTKERVDRDEQQTQAAIKIQKTARMFVAVRWFQRTMESNQKKKAAETIQHMWRKHDSELQAESVARQLVSSIKIQSVVRMFFVRKSWAAKRDALAETRGLTVHREETRDAAATQIQAKWRSVCAQRFASQIRLRKADDKEEQRQDEASRLIQKHVRRCQAQTKVHGLKQEQQKRQQQQVVRQPTPPSGGGNSSGSRNEAVLPVPPPRRRHSVQIQE